MATEDQKKMLRAFNSTNGQSPYRQGLTTQFLPQEETVVEAGILRRLYNGLVGRARLKKTQTVVPSYFYEPEPKVRKPTYDYFSLMVKSVYAWPFRIMIEAIIREATRNYGHIEPRFKYKCDKCGVKYFKEIESCETVISKGETCDGTLEVPDYKQRQLLEDIVEHPSEGRTFLEFIKNTIFYTCAVDDFYWHVTYKSREWGHPIGDKVYIESSAFLFPVADKHGHLGSYDYYCPKCYNSPEYDGHDLTWNMRDEMDRRRGKVGNIHVFRCPICRTIMVQTSYVQEIAGKITARFGKNEIVHGSMSRLAPDLFGTPKMVSLVKILDFMNATDDRKRETAIESRTNGLLFFPGIDHEAVGTLLSKVDEERRKLQLRDRQTGEALASKRNVLVFVGLGDDKLEKPVKIPIMEDDSAMQTMETYQLYLHAIADMFGINTVLKPIKVSGGERSYKLSLEVQDKTILDYQRLFMLTFNDQLLPKFAITDWIWMFDKIEPKDKERDSQVWVNKAAAALNLLKAGFNVRIDDNDELDVSGEGSVEVLIQTTGSHLGQPNQNEGETPGRTGDQFGPHLDEVRDETKKIDSLVKETKDRMNILMEQTYTNFNNELVKNIAQIQNSFHQELYTVRRELLKLQGEVEFQKQLEEKADKATERKIKSLDKEAKEKKVKLMNRLLGEGEEE